MSAEENQMALPRQRLRQHGRQRRTIWREINENLRESEIRAALAAYGANVPRNRSVFRHGDFWPGNVIWQGGEIAAVIDWEEARFGDPLADLSICRLDLLWVVGYEGMLEFTELYQAQMRLDLTDLAYADLCASLRPITNIHEWASSYPPLGRPDITTETMSAGHQLF
ncbi:MAG: aminoglycoside phosphotransferase family protein, partial [Opitutaceae bacterium]|nr:aminoglycoside phosphotransferase family protein [Opitutaceae bacterium]